MGVSVVYECIFWIFIGCGQVVFFYFVHDIYFEYRRHRYGENTLALIHWIRDRYFVRYSYYDLSQTKQCIQALIHNYILNKYGSIPIEIEKLCLEYLNNIHPLYIHYGPFTITQFMRNHWLRANQIVKLKYDPKYIKNCQILSDVVDDNVMCCTTRCGIGCLWELGVIILLFGFGSVMEIIIFCIITLMSICFICFVQQSFCFNKKSSYQLKCEQLNKPHTMNWKYWETLSIFEKKRYAVMNQTYYQRDSDSAWSLYNNDDSQDVTVTLL